MTGIGNLPGATREISARKSAVEPRHLVDGSAIEPRQAGPHGATACIDGHAAIELTDDGERNDVVG